MKCAGLLDDSNWDAILEQRKSSDKAGGATANLWVRMSGECRTELDRLTMRI